MPTIYEDIGNSARTRFRDQVETPQGIAVVYDNGPDTHPDDILWAMWTVLPTTTNQVTVGLNATYRTIGIAVAQIFQPIEQGDQQALQLADIVADAFRAQQQDSLRFLVPSVSVIGRRGKWWQVNVSCPFQCDTTP